MGGKGHEGRRHGKPYSTVRGPKPHNLFTLFIETAAATFAPVRPPRLPTTFDRRAYANDALLHLYRELLKPRLVEEKMLILLRQGKVSGCCLPRLG